MVFAWQSCYSVTAPARRAGAVRSARRVKAQRLGLASRLASRGRGGGLTERKKAESHTTSTVRAVRDARVFVCENIVYHQLLVQMRARASFRKLKNV